MIEKKRFCGRGGFVVHMTLEEREKIEELIGKDMSASQIARIIGRNKHTVNREISRSGGRDTYRAINANEEARERLFSRGSGTRKEFSAEEEAEIDRMAEKGMSRKDISRKLRAGSARVDRYLYNKKTGAPDSIPNRLRCIEEQIAILFEIVKGRK